MGESLEEVVYRLLRDTLPPEQRRVIADEIQEWYQERLREMYERGELSYDPDAE